MDQSQKLIDILKKNSVSFFTGVPDSVLKNFIDLLDKEKNFSHIISANEGLAVSLAIGNYFATNKVPLVYMQNSGLGNAINPLTSIADKKVYSVPLILLIGWRGAKGEKDEPQHEVMGGITKQLLNLLKIKYVEISDSYSFIKIKKLILYAKKFRKPVAILVKKNFFNKSKKVSKNILENKNLFLRKDVIEELLGKLPKNARIISTTGYTSRELFQLRRDLNINKGIDFYMVGGMGHASSFSNGFSYSAKRSEKIICLDGDGSFLMHLGSLLFSNILNNKNFKHILINNNIHESVGLQTTNINKINIKKLISSFSYKNYFFSNNKKSFKKKLNLFLKTNGPSFFEVKVSPGFIKNLERPKNFIKIRDNFTKKNNVC